MRKRIFHGYISRKKQRRILRKKELQRHSDGILHVELQCARCKATFPDYLKRCPECGSTEMLGFVEVNPYSTLPMENFLRWCAHLLWLSATIGCVLLLWQTGGSDDSENILFAISGVVVLFVGVLLSAAYFGLSENNRRLVRLQRRLRVFHDSYRHHVMAEQVAHGAKHISEA